MERRFAIKFTSEALQEYRELDNSIINEVNKAMEDLESRADEIGKRLSNKREINLTGTKERKFVSSGIRIIFQITGQTCTQSLLLDWNPPPALTQEDLTQPSMIDQIFDESFDDIEENIKQVILELFNHGDIYAAYEIWRQYQGQ